MAISFSKYLSVKDNYCITYFGKDRNLIQKIIKVRDLIENELKGFKIYIACDDDFRSLINGKRNIILNSQMNEHQGKFIGSNNLETEESLNKMLSEANIKYFE